jgi:hypothetical protein
MCCPCGAHTVYFNVLSFVVCVCCCPSILITPLVFSNWLDLNSKQEGVRLVGFKYQKGYDWLDSQFHCSYLESRGVPENTREIPGKRGKFSPFHFRFKISDEVICGDATSGDVISGNATSGRTCARDHLRHHHTAPPQMLTELSPYTTTVLYNRHCTRRCTI